jgi:hypothetical protein
MLPLLSFKSWVSPESYAGPSHVIIFAGEMLQIISRGVRDLFVLSMSFLFNAIHLLAFTFISLLNNVLEIPGSCAPGTSSAQWRSRKQE